MSTGRRAALLIAWVLAIAGLTLYVQQTLHISTDLRSFMPPAQTSEQRLLLDEIGEGPGSRLLLLAISGGTPEQLADISRRYAQALRGDPRFLRALNGETDLGMLGDSILSYRYLLSPTLDHARYDREYLADALQQRVEDLGSPAAGLLKPFLGRDPTLETLKLAESWQPAREPERLFDVWFSRDHSQALLLVETRAAGFDPQGQGDALDALHDSFSKVINGIKAELEISGPGAFTVLMNATTSNQANWIGTFDGIGFFLLLLFAYRSFLTVLLGALPLVGAGLLGAAALSLFFGGAHGITLAFGFTLIGVAQDYPIHLFSHQHPGLSAQDNARALWPTLSTGVASTCIAYLAFLASGVAGLMQLAVFTIVGLAAAALGTRFLLPPLMPKRARDAADSPATARLWRWLARLPRPRWLPAALAAVAVAVIWLMPGEFWENNLAALTPVPAKLMLRDGELRDQLGAPDVRYLLVIEGHDVDAVLAESERLDAGMAALRERGVLDGYDLPSRYLPSVATQRARQAALPEPAALGAALDQALSDLPFKAGLFAPFLADVEQARHLQPLTLQQFEQSPLELKLKAMLLSRGDHWVGLVSLVGVHDAGALRDFAAQDSHNASLMDLKHASESLVGDYRSRILLSLAIAGVLLIGVVGFALRSLSRVRRVLLPMALTTLIILAVLRGFGVSLSLFHLIALILAAGLGLDYALFFEHVEDNRRDQLRTLHAVVVCSISTFFVFAMLALSSLPVLRAIGVTVGIGIVFNFLLAILITREREAA